MLPIHIGRYEIQQLLSKGGMASLYLARDPGLDRLVVIKLLKDDYTEDEELRERVARETRALVRLRHPNIGAVYDVGEHERRLFLAMEYIDGETLGQRLARTPPLNLGLGLAIVEDLCAGLASAHDAGIVHHDINPYSIMIDRQGVLKLLGFGIAREPGMIFRSYNSYMSPEELLGEMVDKRSDIFAVGAVLYKVIAREEAFPRALTDVYQQVLTAGPIPLEQHVPGVDPALVRIVMRALQRVPKERYQDVNDMRRELSRARQRLAELPGGADDAHATVVLPRTPSARRQRESEARRGLVTEQLRLGQEAFARGDFDTSLQYGERAAFVDPDNAAAIELIDKSRVAIETKSIMPRQEVNRLLDENVQFTVFRPKVLAPAVWHTMLVFAHLSEPRADASPDEPHPVKEMERQAEAVLGTLDAHGQQTVDSLESVPRDGELTLVPHAEGITFNPASRQFTWKESVHREEFRLRADAVSSRETIRGRLSVYLGSLVIAEVGLTFRIGADNSTVGETVRDVARRYRRIFASYSHLDGAVVDEFTEYARAMGDRYLRDVIDVRAGERWQAALEDLIRQADVFQLFWSWNALASPYVRHEWQYALSLQRPSFIRPVYWDDPLPARGDLPPAVLTAMHFERIRPRRAPFRPPSAVASVGEPPQSIPPVPPPSENTGVIAIPIVDPRPVTPPRPVARVKMAPGSARDTDTTTMGIPAARPRPRSTQKEPELSGRPRPPWRIIGSVAAGIVLFVVGTGFWLGELSSPPASVDSPSNPTTTPPPPPPLKPVPPLPPVPAVPPARLTIRVLAPDAKTASEAEARVVEIKSGRTVTDGVADDGGTIVLDGVSRGRYQLIVSAPGHPDLVREVDVDDDQTIEIKLDER